MNQLYIDNHHNYTPEELAYLQDISYCDQVLRRDNITFESIAAYAAMKKQNIEKLVDLKHHNAICGGTDGKRYHTRVGGNKQIFASSLDSLYEKLYQHYYGEHTYTIGQLYEPYSQWKQEKMHLTEESVRRERDMYRKYIASSRLAGMKITDVKASDIESFFTSYSEQITRHTLGNIKSVLNGIFDYAVASDLVPYNVARQYNTRTIKTVAETSHYDVYTDSDRDRILAVLEPSTNIYDLAIQFMFCLCCRIGEIRALHWEDIAADDSFVIIHREIVSRADKDGSNHYLEVNHTKTGHDSGVRVLPLNDRARNVLQKIRNSYGTGTTYVFTSKNGKFIYETPFGEHLRAACEKAGVQYRSSHKIRFWAASSLASNGASVQDLMSIGGWSNTETAMRYIRMNNVGKRTKRLFEEAVR